MTILIIAEHDNKSISNSTLSVITAALQITDDIHLFIAGLDCNEVLSSAIYLDGLNKVIVADHKVYEYQLAENLAILLAEIGEQYSHILAASTSFGKNLLPRIAALLDVNMVSDIISINEPDTFQRPIYAGNAIATVKVNDRIKVLSIRATAFDSVSPISESVEVIRIEQVIENTNSEFDCSELVESDRPELSTAKVVISGGRGMQNAESFEQLYKVADLLGAGVGASRAAVDAGFVSNDMQIGQTGKIVAPDLYIAVGISGAIQHLAGMRGSKVIVAINKDAEAPIFQVADYGLVADLFTALPELENLLTH